MSVGSELIEQEHCRIGEIGIGEFPIGGAFTYSTVGDTNIIFEVVEDGKDIEVDVIRQRQIVFESDGEQIQTVVDDIDPVNIEFITEERERFVEFEGSEEVLSFSSEDRLSPINLVFRVEEDAKDMQFESDSEKDVTMGGPDELEPLTIVFEVEEDERDFEWSD